MYLRFLRDKDAVEYPIQESEISEISLDKVKISNKDIPGIAGGFDIILDADRTSEFYRSYTVVYEHTKDYVIFTSDTNTYYTYYLYSGDKNYVYSMTTTAFQIADNAILKSSGQGKKNQYPDYEELLDADGFYLYKVYGGKIVPTTDNDKAEWQAAKDAEELIEAKSQKKSEISGICQANIVNGVDLNGSHFSYDFSDQNNISNMTTLALQTGLSVPYHADGEDCRLFTKDEIVALYVAEETNVTHNVTYNNQMKDYIDSLDDVVTIRDIRYGDPLTGKWLDTYNSMMAQAQKIIEAFIGE